jgi:two-component sensor histidine kinase
MEKPKEIAGFARLRHFLAAPIFEDDEDKTRQAGVLNTILVAWMVGSVIMTATVPFMGLDVVIWLTISLLFDSTVVGLWFVMRRGRVRLVSALLSLMLYVFFTFLTYAFGGVSTVSYSGYISTVLIAGLLMGGQAAVISAGAGIFAGVIIWYIEVRGLLPASPMQLSPFLAWMTGSMNLALAAITLYLATTSVNNAFERVRRNERTLDERNRELRHEIVERQRVEEALQLARNELEVRVQERTAALAQTNAALEQEVAERKLAEGRVRKSLEEKEVLLKEIHHRVKNNLQIISSLLTLQSDYIDDERLLAMFVESQNRVRSMALVHERLYQSPNLAQVEFGKYIEQFTEQLLSTYQPSLGQVVLRVDVQQDVALSIDEAVPCGFILNELVSNALKHAFPNGRSGEICVGLYRKDNGRVTLRVDDDGVGFPETTDVHNTESLGMQLVIALVDQLDGTIKLDRQRGTAIQIEFDVPSHSVRQTT